MPTARVRRPTQSAVSRRFSAKACREDASNCSERGLRQQILFGNLNPWESRDYTLTRDEEKINPRKRCGVIRRLRRLHSLRNSHKKAQKAQEKNWSAPFVTTGENFTVPKGSLCLLPLFVANFFFNLCNLRNLRNLRITSSQSRTSAPCLLPPSRSPVHSRRDA